MTLLILIGGVFSPVQAAITFVGGALAGSGGGNQSIGAGRGSQITIPPNGALTAMTVPRPTGTQTGDALVAQFIVRPQGTSITSPSGWNLFRRTTQTSGGNNTPPCGLDIISYFRIVPAGEPAGGSDTWYISYPYSQQYPGGWPGNLNGCAGLSDGNGYPYVPGTQNTVAIGGMLAFRGTFPLSPVYYSGDDIVNNGQSITHFAPSINVGVFNTMIISGIGFLNSDPFGTPSRSGGVEATAPTVGLNQWACPSTNCNPGERVNNDVGLSLQMSYFNQSSTGNTGTVTATASGGRDNGIGHMVAISETASSIDLAITKTGVITGGGPYNAAYTINVKNNGATTETGPIKVVDTLPTDLTYVNSSGSNWHCSRALQTVTCVYGTGASAPYTGIPLAYNAGATPLTINARTTTPAVYTNTANVTGQAGDADYSDNTANSTNTIGNATLFSGKAYNDVNRNNSFDTGETGIGQTLYVKVTPRTGGACNGPATMAIPTDPVTGAYGFGINNGNYCLIINTNNLLTDITPAIPASYIGTEAATGVINTFTAVAGTPQSALNFGLFQPANIKVIKTLAPAGDAGRFNLQITGGAPVGGTNPANNVGDAGTTDYVSVSRSTAITVQETAAAGTSLSQYATTLSCTEGDNVTPVSLASSDLTNSTTRSGTFISPSPVFVGTKSQVICTFTNSTYDYGDAPSGGTLADAVARNYGSAAHIRPTSSTVYLGNVAPDADAAANQTAWQAQTTANGDDASNAADEGIVQLLASSLNSFPALIAGSTGYSLTLRCAGTTAANAVSGWIDFNNNGTFDNSERAQGTCSSAGVGTVTLNWSGLTGLTAGNTFARFRIAGNAAESGSATGAAADGEVEDYAFTVRAAAYAITGVVFKDSGTGSGTANDGIKNGTEAGLANVAVKLTDCAVPPAVPVIYSTATTDGSGNYRLAIGATPPGAVCVEETNLSSYTSTGANVAGSTAPAGYTLTTADKIGFTLVADTDYAGLNFGDVPANQFITDGAKTGIAGSTLIYPHTFIAGSGGTVAFSLPGATASPAIAGWSEQLYLDSDCNAVLDGNEGNNALPSTAITVVEAQTVCLIQKEFIPPGASQGASNQVPVQATFVYTGSSLPNAVYTRQDITIVSSVALSLYKEVRNLTTNGPWTTHNTAKPGEILEYRITFMNNGPESIQNLQINDATLAFTTFVSGLCDPPIAATPASLGLCSLTKTLTNNTGSLKWTFTSAPTPSLLHPGGAGFVTYQVKVD